MTKRALGAGLLALGCLWYPTAWAADGASLAEATEGDEKLARDAYDKAMTAFHEGDYEEALIGFRESYSIVASPDIRFMVARTLARLGRFDEAVVEFDRVIFETAHELEKTEKYTETHSAAIAERDEFLAKLAQVTVVVVKPPEGTVVYVESRKLAADELEQPLRLMPGATHFRAEPPSGPAWEVTADLAPGKPMSITLQAPKPHVFTPGEHPDAWLELEAHLALTSFDAPGPADPGAGVGVGVTVIFWDNGPFGSLNNTLGGGVRGAIINVTGDTFLSWRKTYSLLPIYLQYNLWSSERAALIVEPEATYVRAKTETRWIPGFRFGGRYRFEGGLALVVRFGWPGLTAGASYAF